MLENEFIEQMRQKLLAERATVQQEINELSKPESGFDNPEVDDLAQDAVDDLLEESSVHGLKNLLTEIEEALERIEDGSYGLCQETGRPLPKELLLEKPWARILPRSLR